MIGTSKERINAAIQILIYEGNKSFIWPEQAKPGAAIGLAFASANIDYNVLLEAAASVAEDWNHHTEAKQIRDLNETI